MTVNSQDVNSKDAHVWMVGGGISSMAAAVFLIRDVGMAGDHIHILEASTIAGGSLDGGTSPVATGYVTRGGRMLEDEAYRCLWNLLETIPDRDDPAIPARQAIIDFDDRVKTAAHGRLVDQDQCIIDAARYGFTLRDRAELTRLLAVPEHTLGVSGQTRSRALVVSPQDRPPSRSRQ